MNTLTQKYSHIFSHLKNLKGKKWGPVYFVGIDAEWCTKSARNHVLSYQIATVSQCRGKNIIKYVPDGQRLTLAELISLGIGSVDGSLTSENTDEKCLVVLCAHNFTAEWSVLADRDESHITKRLALVRKSPITDGHTIKLDIEGCLVHVMFFDTMLLAPASHRSLSALSKLLGDEDEEKISLKQREIEHMDQLLLADPKRYEAYALRDSEVCLKLFFLLQDALNQLAYGEGKFLKLFRTLASAGVDGFLYQDENDWFDDYLIGLGHVSDTDSENEKFDPAQIADFKHAYRLIRRAYHGGRSESYLCGKTSKFEQTRDRVWIDIDLSNAYPSGMALCPKIDVYGQIHVIPARYRFTGAAAKALREAGFSQSVVRAGWKAWRESVEAFEGFLAEMRPRRRAAVFRSCVQVVDNTLIDRWVQLSKNQDGPMAATGWLVPGFARIRFKFPEQTQYPCLAVKHPQFGLLYPLEGETVATSIEILLALEAGATIDAVSSVELPIEQQSDGPNCFFRNHLQSLIRQRTAYKKKKDDPTAKIFEKLLKEFTNSFYGKFAQAINPRSVYRPNKGVMAPLGRSRLTEPCVAALTTGLVRGVLSALLIGVARFNQQYGQRLGGDIQVVSATTDGLLIGVPRPEGFSVEADYYCQKNGVSVLRAEVDPSADVQQALQTETLFKRLGCGALLDVFEQFLPVRQLQQARKNLTGSASYLEVKHLVDEVSSIKTRGQIGWLENGDIPLLARFGHKPPLSEIIEDPEEYKQVMEAGGTLRNNHDGRWLLDQIDQIVEGQDGGRIPRYPFFNLTSFKKILESDGVLDLTRQSSERQVNTDFDWKRKLLGSHNPITVPFQDVDEMLTYRRSMQSIRKTGFAAKPELVLHRVSHKNRRTRVRGGDAVTAVNHFLRGILQQHLPFKRARRSYPKLAAMVNHVWQEVGQRDGIHLPHKTWTATDFKNAKRAVWEPGVLLNDRVSCLLVEELCCCFDVNVEQASQLLFTAPQFREESRAQVLAVCKAILLAPKLRISPFYDDFEAGKMPLERDLLAIFRPQLTEGLLASCRTGPFDVQCYPHEREALQRLFRRCGIAAQDAKKYARILAPSSGSRASFRANPAKKSCLEKFVVALHQSDVNLVSLKPAQILDRLSYFGLTRRRLQELKEQSFSPYCLNNTPENRAQLVHMARSLNLDPQLYITTLLDH